jgi:hypothetical protein
VCIFDAVVVVPVLWMDLKNSPLWILVKGCGARCSMPIGYESSCIVRNGIQLRNYLKERKNRG